MSDEDISQILRTQGHRVTRPRLAVWEALRATGGHVTAEELAARAERIEPGLNLASVYRSLALFEELDLARETRLGDDDASRWELAHPDEHFHLVCEDCGNVSHHVGDLVAQVTHHVRDDHGFEPRAVELIVSGRCRNCAGRDVAR